MRKNIFIILILLLPFFLLGTLIKGNLHSTINWNVGAHPMEIYLQRVVSSNFLKGQIKIADSEIEVYFKGGNEPILIVDTDNDGSFEEEGPSEMYLRETDGYMDGRFWRELVNVSYIKNDKDYNEEILLEFFATKLGIFGDYTLEYWISSHQEGLLFINNSEYKISLFTSRSDGDYSILSDIHFGIDRNLDGNIELTILSPEIYSADEVIGLNEANLKVKEITRDGKLITLEVVDEKPAFKPYLNTGNKAPEIEVEDINGNKVNIPGEKNTILILTSFMEDINYRLIDIIDIAENWSAYDHKNTQIVVLLTGKDDIEEIIDNENIIVIKNEEMLKTYGYEEAERVFIIDSEGIIRATDEIWIDEESMLSSHPQGGQLNLTIEDIKKVLLETN